ncbi:MAG: helix-turn-helix domain-containing protein [Bacilli bacterium]
MKSDNKENKQKDTTVTEEIEGLLHFDNDDIVVADVDIPEVNIISDVLELQKDIKIEFDTEPIEKIAKKRMKKAAIETDESSEEKPLKLKKLEKKKLRVINRLIAGEINGPKAAKLLKITTRQVRNLKRQVLNEGEAGVIHKNRYYKPVNTYETDIRKTIAKTYRAEFRGTNFTEFARIMQERGYDLSRSTIYNILRENRIRSPQRKKVKRKKTTPTQVKETVKK